jgi:vitamin B12/bleomycin/antimicrobial peptide transport system ATP-binding/permease protein
LPLRRNENSPSSIAGSITLSRVVNVMPTLAWFSIASKPPGASGASDPDRAQRRSLLKRFWYTASGYWSAGAHSSAWTLSAGLLLIIICLLGAAYAMNAWNRAMFDGLQNRDVAAVGKLSALYFVILAVSVLLSVIQVHARMALQRRWRAWLTNNLVDRWLAHGRYYQLNLVRGDHANPEYRIADDVRIATESPVDFVSGVTQALLSAAMFIVVLWTIGGALDVSFGGLQLHIPGFLVIAALVYAVVASGSMLLIGSRFVHASETKNQAEAEYRYVITRLRENGESIALIRGEEEERTGLDRALGKVLAGWAQIAKQNMKTTVVSQTSNYIAPVLPIILCSPKFLDGSMSLGEVMQAASAFTIVQGAFNWLVDNYPKMADWTASARRVASLMIALDALEEAEHSEGVGRITIDREGKGPALRLQDLSVRLNDGTAVVDDTDVSIAPGERVLIAGASGSGKSTLVRAIAGLWPWGGGAIEVKKGARMFLLPQRPYVPIGTLRRAATYPDAPDSRSLEEITVAFKQVGLEALVDKLDKEAPWDQTLSGGEKQRLAFARILLHNPDIVVLDEATAALDPGSQNKLMQLLVERPEITLLSVGHRPELEPFHSRKITLERRPGGAKLVDDVELPGESLRQSMWRWLRRQAREAPKPTASPEAASRPKT